jgi:glyoxylase-like metal-dependent hydrolase (beta-lactamase superfamily II)
VIIGDKFIMVSDCTATPAMARDLIARIRTVSDKPIKYVLLTHYHAVRVLGASAYCAEGATEIIASQGTYELIAERGARTCSPRWTASRACSATPRKCPA